MIGETALSIVSYPASPTRAECRLRSCLWYDELQNRMMMRTAKAESATRETETCAGQGSS